MNKKPPVYEAIDLLELARGVPRAKVVTPTPQDRIDHPDHVPDVFHPCPAAAVG